MRILVADDDAMVLKIIVRLLQHLKHEVVGVGDGSKALLQLKEREFDVAILDQNMPGLQGAEVLARLREFNPKMPVFLSSGDPSLELQDPHAQRLAKPYRLEALEAALSGIAAR